MAEALASRLELFRTLQYLRRQLVHHSLPCSLQAPAQHLQEDLCGWLTLTCSVHRTAKGFGICTVNMGGKNRSTMVEPLLVPMWREVNCY